MGIFRPHSTDVRFHNLSAQLTLSGFDDLLQSLLEPQAL